MGRSLALALYMTAAARGGPGPEPARPPRPEGRLVWLHAGADSTSASVAQLAQRLVQEDATLSLLISAEDAPPHLKGFPGGARADLLPPDRLACLRPFLDHWCPDLLILVGASLPPALIVECHDRAIPLVLADFQMTAAAASAWRWRRGMARSLLGRFRRILARESDSAERLRRMAGRNVAVETAGRIEETTEPLHANEAERASLAELLHARPVWLAAACPEAEEEVVLAAQAHAMRFAHRLLLILVPTDPGRAGPLAERVARENWLVALRAREEEPEAAVQVFIAEGMAELGLWYRLAPVTYMGGTLTQRGAGRNPFEPAALGSAILHGPHPGPYPSAYARLAAAGATRQVESAAQLATAVADLIAPDKAATLAHNAWAISSGGAEVAEHVVEVILDTLGSGGGKAVA
ncbi:3-deoxy-D-manno-octulosonic acid transferase [Defluviimonas aquaemixtae]|uniref:3-deoxy-D-manno-octulosonic acid transferase n=1 Tax=Albidovulum aquaemixtae TaxID=1542388 RepID=A0A2R8BKA4_9RHOB|nr:glycosyltransferase N-terminal domain-containing protein [Defluviimonas aquaemixtae]SPH23817.1 3-deoxy-D-manno-octulosonic acid transferase [Defluviimonas aquaemixtae]